MKLFVEKLLQSHDIGQQNCPGEDGRYDILRRMKYGHV